MASRRTHVLGDMLGELRTRLLTSSRCNLIAGFLIPGIDNAAHVGGLVAGVVFGWLVGRDSLTAAPPLRRTVFPLALAAGLAVTAVAFSGERRDVRSEVARFGARGRPRRGRVPGGGSRCRGAAADGGRRGRRDRSDGAADGACGAAPRRCAADRAPRHGSRPPAPSIRMAVSTTGDVCPRFAPMRRKRTPGWCSWRPMTKPGGCARAACATATPPASSPPIRGRPTPAAPSRPCWRDRARTPRIDPMLRTRRPIVASAALLAAICFASGSAAAQAPAAAEDDTTRVPGATWTTVKPESAGYSSARLESLRSWLKTLDTKAMLIAVHGQVIFEYGDVTHASKIASVRKSILSMLYGPYFASGRMDPRTDRGRSRPAGAGAVPAHRDARDAPAPADGAVRDLLEVGQRQPRRGRAKARLGVSGHAHAIQQLGLQRRRHRLREAFRQVDLRGARAGPRPPDRHAGLRCEETGQGPEPGLGASRVRDAALDARPRPPRPADAARRPLARHASSCRSNGSATRRR